LSRLGTLLDVHNELLLALLELCALAVEFALRLCQRALMLAQTLRWRYGATEERFLAIERFRTQYDCGKLQYGMMISGEKTYDDVHDMIRWKDYLELRWAQQRFKFPGLAGP
jgi:hypothetical protein